MNPRMFGWSLTAAVLLALALSVHGAFAWTVAAPFACLAGDRRHWHHAAAFGALFAAAAAVPTQAPWLAETAQRYFALEPAGAWVAALVLTVPVAAIQGAALGVPLRLALGLRGAWAVAAGGAVWAVWERALLEVFPYYPWPSLAAAQADLVLPLLSTAILTQTGLTALTAAAGLSIGQAVRVHGNGGRMGRLLPAGAAAMLAAAAAAWMLASPPGGGDAECIIDAVDPGTAGPDLGRAVEITERWARSWPAPPDAVVWPESALPASPSTDSRLRDELLALSESLGAPLIAGGPRVSWDRDWNERRYNSAFRLQPGSGLVWYDKRRLVPFAEYWPAAPLPASPALRTTYVEAGEAAVLFDAGRCRLGILVCFEAQDPGLARRLAREGAAAVVVLSNDAPLGARAVAMEIRQARLRAAETGVPVLRVANGGGTIGALPTGGLAVSDAAVLRLRLAAVARLAPAVFLGPWILGGCVLLSALALVRGAVVHRRRTAALPVHSTRSPAPSRPPSRPSP